MDLLIVHLYLCIAFPTMLGLFFVEKRARLLLIFLQIGLFMCMFAGYLNTSLTKISDMSYYEATYLLTPFVEELLKGIPVLFYTILFRPEKKQLVGISVMTGIGFAIMENVYVSVISSAESITLMWTLMRGLGAGMMHGLCTVFISYGMFCIGGRKKVAFVSSFACITFAILFHASYNLLIQSQYKFYGILLPLTTIVVLYVVERRNRKHTDKRKKAVL